MSGRWTDCCTRSLVVRKHSIANTPLTRVVNTPMETNTVLSVVLIILWLTMSIKAARTNSGTFS